MVRTSDFQSENAGSIPPGPIYMKFKSSINIISAVTKNSNNQRLKKVQHGFYFTSIISPYIINNARLLNLSSNNYSDKKVLVKQSYILLTWFYYMTMLDPTSVKKKLKIAILPKKTKKFTLTKAPMAHKNWSKEQYDFSYFKFKVSFKSLFKSDTCVQSLNQLSLFILLTKNSINSFETNLFFLKYFQSILFFKDVLFFNYNSNCKQLTINN